MVSDELRNVYLDYDTFSIIFSASDFFSKKKEEYDNNFKYAIEKYCSKSKISLFHEESFKIDESFDDMICGAWNSVAEEYSDIVSIFDNNKLGFDVLGFYKPSVLGEFNNIKSALELLLNFKNSDLYIKRNNLTEKDCEIVINDHISNINLALNEYNNIINKWSTSLENIGIKRKEHPELDSNNIVLFDKYNNALERLNEEPHNDECLNNFRDSMKEISNFLSNTYGTIWSNKSNTFVSRLKEMVKDFNVIYSCDGDKNKMLEYIRDISLSKVEYRVETKWTISGKKLFAVKNK